MSDSNEKNMKKLDADELRELRKAAIEHYERSGKGPGGYPASHRIVRQSSDS